MSSIYIKSGWRATGLHSYNLNKTLTSSLILQTNQPSQLALKSPPPPSHRVIATSHNRRELRASIDALASIEELSKSVRLLFNKAAKAFDELHTEAAEKTLRLRGQ